MLSARHSTPRQHHTPAAEGAAATAIERPASEEAITARLGITPRRRQPTATHGKASVADAPQGAACAGADLASASFVRPSGLSRLSLQRPASPPDFTFGGLAANAAQLPVAPFERWATEEAPTPPGAPEKLQAASGVKKSGRRTTGRTRRSA